MHGVKRVAAFCLMTAILPAVLIILPLYLRHSLFADVPYVVAESDIMEIRDGISTVFCQAHSLRMNATFSAYQVNEKPHFSQTRHKHIRLKKSMSLPDDTLEYWGFYLMKGARVNLNVCSRFDGSRILVVQGGRNLKTCGLMEHNRAKKHRGLSNVGHENELVIMYETKAEVIRSKEHDKDKSEEMENVDEVDQLKNMAQKHILKHSNKIDTEAQEGELNDGEVVARNRHRRNHRHNGRHQNRVPRDLILDRKIFHGNYTEMKSESESSFENSLRQCYDGEILLDGDFEPSKQCDSIKYLESSNKHVNTTHYVQADGYYYYIFYSDNDYIRNHIHAIFDIYKPTFEYLVDGKESVCVNSTQCTFPIGFLSQQTVIVEVPTRDGIEHEEDDITLLISTCEPRKAVYVFFPIAVLFLILGCAFL